METTDQSKLAWFRLYTSARACVKTGLAVSVANLEHQNKVKKIGQIIRTMFSVLLYLSMLECRKIKEIFKSFEIIHLLTFKPRFMGSSNIQTESLIFLTLLKTTFSVILLSLLDNLSPIQPQSYYLISLHIWV